MVSSHDDEFSSMVSNRLCGTSQRYERFNQKVDTYSVSSLGRPAEPQRLAFIYIYVLYYGANEHAAPLMVIPINIRNTRGVTDACFFSKVPSSFVFGKTAECYIQSFVARDK